MRMIMMICFNKGVCNIISLRPTGREERTKE